MQYSFVVNEFVFFKFSFTDEYMGECFHLPSALVVNNLAGTYYKEGLQRFAGLIMHVRTLTT